MWRSRAPRRKPLPVAATWGRLRISAGQLVEDPRGGPRLVGCLVPGRSSSSWASDLGLGDVAELSVGVPELGLGG